MKSKIVRSFALSSFIFIGISFLAAIPVRQAGSEKKNRYLDAGVFVGGRDQGPINLLNVRHNPQAEGKVERLVFDEGLERKVANPRAGFFHITIQKAPRRVVIDLENINQTRVTAAELSKLLEKSPHFGKPHFFYDEKFKNLTIEMPLKDQAKIEVFELVTEGKPGRVVLDVQTER